MHADRKTSGAFTTRIPGRSKFRKWGLKCSGLKQKMNSRGRRSSVRVAIRIDSCRSLSFVCWVKPVHRTTKDRKSTRLNSSHANISYAVFCLKKKKRKKK